MPPPTSTLFPYTTLFRSIAMGGMGIYVASKHAVIGLTKAAALEVAKQGVRVNTVSPAAIETEMYDRFVGGPDERSEEHTSELQSLTNLVCRLLLEKKKKK